jgi:hyperosmotically inducible protein
MCHWLVGNQMRLFLLLSLVALLSGCRTNESPEEQVNDLEITTQIKSKLASDVGLSSVTNVSVNSTNGVVTLSGQVDSEDAKAKAGTLANAVPKVVRVVNNLQVVAKKVGADCCGQPSVIIAS